MRNQQDLPPLTEEQILAWADRFNATTGKWPNQSSGVIEGATGETWGNVQAALNMGYRGLPGGSSLALVLEEQRGVRNRANLPEITENQVLEWADAHHRRTGAWPRGSLGAIEDAPGETWKAVDSALCKGMRGLPSGSSLAKLLAKRRGVRNEKALPQLTEEQILTWVDAHYERTGKMPTRDSGQILDAVGENWSIVDGSLKQGRRDLPGGSSLARLIKQHRRTST